MKAAALLGLSLFTGSLPALAAGLPAQLRAEGGQVALSAFVLPDGDVGVAACASAPCSNSPIALGVPNELRKRQVQVESVAIGQQRHALVISIDGASEFRAVVAAPLGTGVPLVLFAGRSGLVNGQPGDQTGPMIQLI